MGSKVVTLQACRDELPSWCLFHIVQARRQSLVEGSSPASSDNPLFNNVSNRLEGVVSTFPSAATVVKDVEVVAMDGD